MSEQVIVARRKTARQKRGERRAQSGAEAQRLNEFPDGQG